VNAPAQKTAGARREYELLSTYDAHAIALLRGLHRI
jgi:hypothetical protein